MFIFLLHRILNFFTLQNSFCIMSKNVNHPEVFFDLFLKFLYFIFTTNFRCFSRKFLLNSFQTSKDSIKIILSYFRLSCQFHHFHLMLLILKHYFLIFCLIFHIGRNNILSFHKLIYSFLPKRRIVFKTSIDAPLSLNF